MVQLYNTLTRKKEVFKPIHAKEVGMYSCGPTVYWYQTIGNLRTYIFSDVLKRVLLYNKYHVNHVMNVTDVGHLVNDSDEGEDKMEKAAAKEGKTAQELATFYLKVFKEDMKKLHILEPSIWAKATQHITEQIKLIQKLEKKGYTYKTSDGIYFNSTKFKNYGKMANLNIDKLEAGKRVDVGEKKSKTDFALWKFSSIPGERQQEWLSPWGLGYPGWHIECSAMSMKYLGEHFDIHTGGEDHIPLHHTNEIAQSEAATGKKFVNYWLHGAFLLFKGEKVSKSKGGLYTVTELEALGYKPEHYRYLCLLTHYRKPLSFTLENLDAAKNAYERISRKIELVRTEKKKGSNVSKHEEAFLSAVNDDLNTPEAVQVFIKTLDDDSLESSYKLKLLEEFDRVLAIGLDTMRQTRPKYSPEIQALIDERTQARQQKNFKRADELRAELQKKGFDVEDTKTGSK